MNPTAAEIFARARGAKVICLGDAMLDRYVYGNATRISPEAPVPVVHVRRQLLIPGGTGNVAVNLDAFGLSPILIGVVGSDAAAASLEELFSGRPGCRLRLVRDPARPTIVKTRVVAGIQQIVRFDEEDTLPLSPEVNRRLLEHFEKSLEEAGVATISDYAKGVVNPDLIREAIHLARAAGKPVVVDPKGRDYGKYAGAYLVKPNRKELAEAAGGDIPDDGAAIEAGRALMTRHGIRNLLITLSDRGMLLLEGGGEPRLLTSRAREVFDVTGAGDTVLAALAVSLAAGVPLETGARFASLAAGVVVGKVGTAFASITEVERAERETE